MSVLSYSSQPLSHSTIPHNHNLDLNFNTHFPLRGSKTMESCGFISSSHLPGLSGTPLHDSYFKTKAERSNRSSIIAILKSAYAHTITTYSLPRHIRGPYPKIIVRSISFDCSSRVRPSHLSSLERHYENSGLVSLNSSGSGKTSGSRQTVNTLCNTLV